MPSTPDSRKRQRTGSEQSTWLIADVGGTNTRVACWQSDCGYRAVQSIAKYRNAEFHTLAELLKHYLSESLPARPERAALAVAAPIRGPLVEMMNIDWQFETSTLCRELGLKALYVINDFHAQACALAVLDDADRLSIKPGEALAGKAMAILGPGTGLGVAGLTPIANGFATVTGEGGHVTLPAANDFEAGLLREIRSRAGHCSAERILSGAGIELLHEVLHGERDVAAGEISRRAHDGNEQALRSFHVFFEFLATVAGDLALTLGALGGTYIAGGIALANKDLLLGSGFNERFVDKGRYRAYLGKIPVWLVTADVPALYGLAYYAGTVDSNA